MEFLAKGFRNALASIVAWMDKAEQEQEEHVQELLKPPNSDLLPPGVQRGEDGSLQYDLDAAEEQARQEARARRAQEASAGSTPAGAGKPPTARPPLPPTSANSPGKPSVGGGPAGFRTRQRGEKAPAGRIVQNKRDDTEYVERDAVVRMVEEQYSHLPPVVSAAVLSRVLASDGMSRLLAKLGLESLGLAGPDHSQVLDFIDENGLEEFCRAAGIRYDSERMKNPPRHAKPPLPKAAPATRTIASESRQRRGGAPSDHRLSFDADKVKPVDLRKRPDGE